MKRYAKAIWNGKGFDGNGNIEVQSQTIAKAKYSFNSRFNDTNGTNSEELLAAAHASDFTMKLSFILSEAGYLPQKLITTCFIDFDRGMLVSSKLNVTAEIAGIEQDVFDKLISEANETCPMSRVLRLNIVIDAHLLTGENFPSEDPELTAI